MRAYRLEGRIKNNRLWQALRRTYPQAVTQTQMAESVGVTATVLSALLTMKKNPMRDARAKNNPHGEAWGIHAKIIAEAVGETPEYLFDQALYGRGSYKFELEVTPKQLGDAGILALPPGPAEVLESAQAAERIEEALTSLNAQQSRVIRLRFGLDDGNVRTLDEVGQELALTTERIRQIQNKALRIMRRPDLNLRDL